MGFGAPRAGSSTPAWDGSGAAAATWMPARGPPLASWFSTRPWAVAAMVNMAVNRAAASATATTVRAARPGRRSTLRAASRKASAQLMGRSSTRWPRVPAVSADVIRAAIQGQLLGRPGRQCPVMGDHHQRAATVAPE